MSIERKLMDLVRRSNAAKPGMTGQCEISACRIVDPKDPTKVRCLGPVVTKKTCDEAGGEFTRVSRSFMPHEPGCPSLGDLCRDLAIEATEMD